MDLKVVMNCVITRSLNVIAYQVNFTLSSAIYKVSPRAKELKMELAGCYLKVGKKSSSLPAALSAPQSLTWKLEACKAALVTVSPLVIQAFLHGSNSIKTRTKDLPLIMIRF